jgi:hypothetical protein
MNREDVHYQAAEIHDIAYGIDDVFHMEYRVLILLDIVP